MDNIYAFDVQCLQGNCYACKTQTKLSSPRKHKFLSLFGGFLLCTACLCYTRFHSVEFLSHVVNLWFSSYKLYVKQNVFICLHLQTFVCILWSYILVLNPWICYHRYASEGPLLGILGYTDDDVVSNDFVGDSRWALVFFKANSLMLASRIKIITSILHSLFPSHSKVEHFRC